MANHTPSSFKLTVTVLSTSSTRSMSLNRIPRSRSALSMAISLAFKQLQLTSLTIRELTRRLSAKLKSRLVSLTLSLREFELLEMLPHRPRYQSRSISVSSARDQTSGEIRSTKRINRAGRTPSPRHCYKCAHARTLMQHVEVSASRPVSPQ